MLNKKSLNHTVSTPILDLMSEHSNKIFIKTPTAQYTYLYCLNVINYLITTFKNDGIWNKNIALKIPNSAGAHLIFLSLIHSNNVLLINPEFGDDFINELISDNKIDVLITDIPNKNIQCRNIVISTDVLPINTAFTLTEPIFGDIKLLSSGTTNKPSAVTIKHTEILKYGTTLAPYFKFNDTDCLYNIIPFFHGFGITRLLTIIESGSSEFVPNVFNPNTMVKEINLHKCTWVSIIPRLIKILSGTGTEKMWPGVQFVTVSAGPVSKNDINEFYNKTKIPLFAEYGCTEASIISSNNFTKSNPGSVGIADSSRVKIDNGRIYVIPQWATTPKWVDTGDVGFIDDDQFLWILGRDKEIIKINGKTIFPYDLESSIIKFAGVDSVVVYPRSISEVIESIGVVYTGTISEDAFRKLCQDQFNLIKCRWHIKCLPEIPLENNKIKRLKLQNYVDSLEQ